MKEYHGRSPPTLPSVMKKVGRYCLDGLTWASPGQVQGFNLSAPPGKT